MWTRVIRFENEASKRKKRKTQNARTLSVWKSKWKFDVKTREFPAIPMAVNKCDRQRKVQQKCIKHLHEIRSKFKNIRISAKPKHISTTIYQLKGGRKATMQRCAAIKSQLARRTILLRFARIKISHPNYFPACHWMLCMWMCGVWAVWALFRLWCGKSHSQIFQNLKWKCCAENWKRMHWLHFEYSIVLIFNWYKIHCIHCEPYACHIYIRITLYRWIGIGYTDFCQRCWRGATEYTQAPRKIVTPTKRHRNRTLFLGLTLLLVSLLLLVLLLVLRQKQSKGNSTNSNSYWLFSRALLSVTVVVLQYFWLFLCHWHDLRAIVLLLFSRLHRKPFETDAR